MLSGIAQLCVKREAFCEFSLKDFFIWSTAIIFPFSGMLRIIFLVRARFCLNRADLKWFPQSLWTGNCLRIVKKFAYWRWKPKLDETFAFQLFETTGKTIFTFHVCSEFAFARMTYLRFFQLIGKSNSYPCITAISK